MSEVRMNSVRIDGRDYPCPDTILAELERLHNALDYVVEHFVGRGNCVTLPNGDCVGVGCMHADEAEAVEEATDANH